MNGERAREAPAGEGRELVGARRLSLLVRERPLLADDPGNAGGGGDEDGLLLVGERDGILVGAEGKRAGELGAECEAAGSPGEDRLESGEGERGLERLRCGPVDVFWSSLPSAATSFLRASGRLYTAVSTTFSRVKPILVIEQEHSLEGLGLLGDRLDASGLPYRQFAAWEERLVELEARDFAAIVPMGGNAHAWAEDDVPLLETERLFLREALNEGVPVLGICLGGQLLVRALGGEVR